MPVLIRLMTTRFPGNSASATAAPDEMPSSMLMSVADPEICNESSVMRSTSGSSVTSR